MPRYYFSLKNGRPFDDVDGLELQISRRPARRRLGSRVTSCGWSTIGGIGQPGSFA
jgi:hypothetical protein